MAHKAADSDQDATMQPTALLKNLARKVRRSLSDQPFYICKQLHEAFTLFTCGLPTLARTRAIQSDRLVSQQFRQIFPREALRVAGFADGAIRLNLDKVRHEILTRKRKARLKQTLKFFAACRGDM